MIWVLKGVDWIDLAGDKYGWRAVVNAVMNRRISQRSEEVLGVRGRGVQKYVLMF